MPDSAFADAVSVLAEVIAAEVLAVAPSHRGGAVREALTDVQSHLTAPMGDLFEAEVLQFLEGAIWIAVWRHKFSHGQSRARAE
jgi:hypothetical protein